MTDDQTALDAAEAEQADDEPVLTLRVEVAELENWQRKLSIEVSQEDVAQRYEDRLGELAGDAHVDGFRQGRVPRELLINRFGKELSDEIKGKLIEQSLRQAAEDEDLKVVTPADLDPEAIEFDASQPLRFEATVEVQPEFDLPEYQNIQLEQEDTEVTGADIEEIIDNLRRRDAVLKPREQGQESENGDTLNIDVVLRVDGETAWEEEEHLVHTHDDHVHGLPCEVDAKHLIGVTAGGELEIEVDVPEDFAPEKFAGKAGTFGVQVNEIKRPELPALDDAFAQEHGAESVDALRDELRERLQDAREKNVEEKIHEALTEKLIERTPFDLPEGMVKNEAKMSLLRQQVSLVRIGLDVDSVMAMGQDEELTDQTREQAVKRIKIALILEKIAEAESIEVDEEDVYEEVQRMAQASGRPVGVVQRQLEQDGRLDGIRETLTQQKVLDFLRENSDISKKSPDSQES